MPTVRLVERDSRGLVTRVVEVDEDDPLLPRIQALEAECDDLRARLADSESNRATETNRVHGELRAAAEASDRTHASTCDLIGELLRESGSAHDQVCRLRAEADAEASRSRVLERALVRIQREADRLREDLDAAEAFIEDNARRNRKARPKKTDVLEAAVNAFAARLYK